MKKTASQILNEVFDSDNQAINAIKKTSGHVLNLVVDDTESALKVKIVGEQPSGCGMTITIPEGYPAKMSKNDEITVTHPDVENLEVIVQVMENVDQTGSKVYSPARVGKNADDVDYGVVHIDSINTVIKKISKGTAQVIPQIWTVSKK
jgi:phosphoribosylamine-glycine ligase